MVGLHEAARLVLEVELGHLSGSREGSMRATAALPREAQPTGDLARVIEADRLRVVADLGDQPGTLAHGLILHVIARST